MRSTWKAVFIFAGVFIAGGVCGVFLSPRVIKPVRPPRPTAQEFAAQMMDRLAKQLELTDEQKTKISPIMQRAQDEMVAQRREHFSGVARVTDKMNAEIAAYLTPEQKTKLDELSRKIRERAERGERGEPRGPRGPGG